VASGRKPPVGPSQCNDRCRETRDTRVELANLNLLIECSLAMRVLGGPLHRSLESGVRRSHSPVREAGVFSRARASFEVCFLQR